jgi:hypothetical protein
MYQGFCHFDLAKNKKIIKKTRKAEGKVNQ